MKPSTTKKIVSLGLSLAVTMIFSSQTHAKASNKELKIGISQEFENMNPLIMTMSASSYMFKMIGRTLVTLDADGKWVTQLAKSIPTIENGGAKLIDDKGKKKVIANWEIIESAKWSDGKPVICEDFELATKIAASPNVSVAEKETFTLVEKIEVDKSNPKKCTFTYDKARWDFNQLAGFTPLPKHLEEDIFKKYGAQKEGYEKNSNYVKNPTLAGLYNGPYMISEVKLGDHVTFIPNPHFYGTQPKIKKIIVKLIPQTGTMEANLRSGTIDMISSLGLDLDQAIAFEKKVKSEGLPFQVHFTPSITYEHIDINLENEILKDIKVRKALMLAMNREDLVKSLFDNKQQVALHLFSPKDPWFTQDASIITTYKYSKREAGKILDEAGWKIGKDGIREKNGKRLSLSFMTTAGNKTRELVQVYLQEQWKQAGIEVIIKNEPARVYFGETVKKKKFPALALFAWGSAPESNPKSTLHTQSIPTAKNGWSGQNDMSYSNKKMDEVTEKLDVEFNPKTRISLAHEVQKMYTEDVPVLPLYYRSDISVVPKEIKGYKMTGHQFQETNQVENWSLE